MLEMGLHFRSISVGTSNWDGFETLFTLNSDTSRYFPFLRIKFYVKAKCEKEAHE